MTANGAPALRHTDDNLPRAWADLHARSERLERAYHEERNRRRSEHARAALARSHVRRLRAALSALIASGDPAALDEALDALADSFEAVA